MPLEEEHIDAIVHGCRLQDRKAQEQLYRGYYEVMMNLCLRYTHNEADALSILNTGFFKVFKSIGSYTPSKGSLYTWIRVIVVNCCVDEIKKRKSTINVGELNDATAVFVEPTIIPKMQQADLLAIIRELSPASQAVFNLYVMEDYSHKEIAKMLNISEGTSKWHLNDARKKIKKSIELLGIKY